MRRSKTSGGVWLVWRCWDRSGMQWCAFSIGAQGSSCTCATGEEDSGGSKGGGRGGGGEGMSAPRACACRSKNGGGVRHKGTHTTGDRKKQSSPTADRPVVGRIKYQVPHFLVRRLDCNFPKNKTNSARALRQSISNHEKKV